MLSLTFYFLLRSVLAADPAHLKPGALSAHLGRVSLVEDVLWVQYPFTALVEIPGTLRTITEQVTGVVLQMDINAPEDGLLRLMHDRIKYLNDTLTLALENYAALSFPNRTKRGLIDGIGQLSRMLFGTAMDEDVEELRDRYNRLASLAATQHKTIRMNSFHISRLEHAVQDIASYSRTLGSSINELWTGMANMYQMELVLQTLPALESAVNSILHTNALVIQNVVDADCGRVTSSLFPVRDLQKALKIGVENHQLTPLFDMHAIHHYYPLLESFLTSEAIVIHVPFRSKDVFEVYQLEPFPFSVNNSVMVLDLPATVVLIRNDLSLYATGQPSDLGSCKTEYHNLYFCSASLFAFLPLTGGICEVVLTQSDASKALETCPYRHVAPKSLFHRRFSGFHYFFFTLPVFVTVVCPEGSTYREVAGHLAVRVACSLRSVNLTTFPETLHHGFAATNAIPIYPIDSLVNLTFSRMKYVTNSLSELTFSNFSELESAVHDSLPVYLAPYVHYPSLVLPVVLFIIIVIPLFCLVKRALTLYNHLQARVAPPR